MKKHLQSRNENERDKDKEISILKNISQDRDFKNKKIEFKD